MVARQPARQRAQAVGIAHREIRVGPERRNRIERVGARCRGLQRKPLVDHQPVGAEAVVEVSEGGIAFRSVEHRQNGERALSVGHVVRRIILRLGQRRAARGIAGSEQGQRDRLQSADALGGARQIVARRALGLRGSKILGERGADGTS